MAISEKQALPMNRPPNSAKQQQFTARSDKPRESGKEEHRSSAAAEKNRAKSNKVSAATQTTARSVDGVARGSRSCRGERTPGSARSDGVAAARRSCRDEQPPDSARSEPRTSGSFTARSSEGSRGATPRETGRTTTSMAMSTARAEATLAVLEAERAQLERRLKKVEEELEQEELVRG